MKTNFSKRLNELMVEKNINSLALSKIVGVNSSTILRWRKGTTNPTIDKLLLLCKFFKVSSNYILGIKD